MPMSLCSKQGVVLHVQLANWDTFGVRIVWSEISKRGRVKVRSFSMFIPRSFVVSPHPTSSNTKRHRVHDLLTVSRMTRFTQQSSRAHARFQVNAAGWDDMPITRGIAQLERSWIVGQPWWSPPLDGPAMDFGCGTGVLTMAIRDGLGEQVLGVDTSRAMLEQFDWKAQGRGVITVPVELTGPGQLGPGADEAFALIYTSLTLHHIRDCERAVSTLAGYLRPGGRLLIFDLEADSNAHEFHASGLEGGNQLEHHGLREADLRGWCASTGILEHIQVDRIPFHEEYGGQGSFGAGKEFNLLAFTCTRAEGARSARNSICLDETNECLACKQREAEYECVPCGCRAFCKRCAMKVATGGRCKRCKEMFTDLKRFM